jgi:hypothetical protein
MNVLRRTALVAAALFASALPASATAAPAPGMATLGSDWYSTFSFTQAADEHNASVSVSPDAAMDATGELTNSAAYANVEFGLTSWRADRKLYAGDYWWQMSAYGNVEFDRRLSAAVPYVVPAILAKPTFAASCTGRNRLAIAGGWRTNVEDLDVDLRISMGRKRVDTIVDYPEWSSSSDIGVPQTFIRTYEPFLASRWAKGTTFRVEYVIDGPGVKFSKTVVVRCR